MWVDIGVDVWRLGIGAQALSQTLQPPETSMQQQAVCQLASQDPASHQLDPGR